MSYFCDLLGGCQSCISMTFWGGGGGGGDVVFL